MNISNFIAEHKIEVQIDFEGKKLELHKDSYSFSHVKIVLALTRDSSWCICKVLYQIKLLLLCIKCVGVGGSDSAVTSY
jgi:hypothetical protein